MMIGLIHCDSKTTLYCQCEHNDFSNRLQRYLIIHLDPRPIYMTVYICLVVLLYLWTTLIDLSLVWVALPLSLYLYLIAVPAVRYFIMSRRRTCQNEKFNVNVPLVLLKWNFCLR